MLRSLVDEVVRRRLWPIPLVALLVAIAAPLVFMKSAPPDAPAASDAPPAAEPGKLPKKAVVLMSGEDKVVVSRKRSTLKAQDPFAPPAGSGEQAADSESASTDGSTSAPQEIPVTITSSDGSTTSATISPSTSSSSSGSKSSSDTSTPSSSSGTATTKQTTTSSQKTTSSSAAPAKTVTYVDVRFGPRMGTMVRYRVPRLQTFRAGGKVAAMFVGYSRKRNAAVFAIAPSTSVSGVTCRKVSNACRYIDLPEGAHARLKLRGKDGSVVSRRLDVVSIRRLSPARPSKATARVTSLPAAKCLLTSLLSLSATAPSISTDACA